MKTRAARGLTNFISMSIILFGTGLVGTASICLAQDGSWTTKTDMQILRHSHGTAVVNGKIYSVGGVTTDPTDAGGCNMSGSKKVEEYDPSTDTWSIKADMLTEREDMSISALNGKIYSIGGNTVTCSGELSRVDEYDPLTDSWTRKTSMQTARVSLSSEVVNGKIYAIGGWKHSTGIVVADVEEYDPITDTWITKADMPTARAGFSSSVVDGKIYVFGGGEAGGSVEVYDPVTDTWSPKDDMPMPDLPIPHTGRMNFTASTVNGLVYVIGGFTLPGSVPISDVSEYNPISDTWSTIDHIPNQARVFASSNSSQLDGNIYIIGGSTTDWPLHPTSTVQVFTPPVATDVENPARSEYIPEAFALHQNYPNPFNPETTIQYQVPKGSAVRLVIFNLLGERIATLVDEVQSMGSHSVQWDGKDDTGKEVASGVYLYRLQTDQFVQVKKLALLR